MNKGKESPRISEPSSEVLARLAADMAVETKARDVCLLDMRRLVNFCDMFVICSGDTDRHVKAIADRIEEGLAKKGLKPYSRQADSRADWIVLDMGSVVAHIFQKQARDFYQLEYLWREAPKEIVSTE